MEQTFGDKGKRSNLKGKLQNRNRAKKDLLKNKGRIRCHGGVSNVLQS